MQSAELKLIYSSRILLYIKDERRNKDLQRIRTEQQQNDNNTCQQHHHHRASPLTLDPDPDTDPIARDTLCTAYAAFEVNFKSQPSTLNALALNATGTYRTVQHTTDPVPHLQHYLHLILAPQVAIQLLLLPNDWAPST